MVSRGPTAKRVVKEEACTDLTSRTASVLDLSMAGSVRKVAIMEGPTTPVPSYALARMASVVIYAKVAASTMESSLMEVANVPRNISANFVS